MEEWIEVLSKCAKPDRGLVAKKSFANLTQTNPASSKSATPSPVSGPANDPLPPLLRACTENDIEAVKKVLSSRVNINAQDALGFTALHIACDFFSLDIIRLLISVHTLDTIVQNCNSYFNFPILVFLFNLLIPLFLFDFLISVFLPQSTV